VQARLFAVALLVVCLAGCDADDSEFTPSPPAPVVMGDGFDPAACGTLTGSVCWKGDHPQVPVIVAHLQPQGPPPLTPARSWPNPHAPRIGPGDGVKGAVVFLREVDPVRSRPWSLGSVRVEQNAYQYRVLQGADPMPVGFVRRGDAITLTSTDEHFYSCHGRGAAYFSLRFVEPHRPVERVLKQPGIVELSSGLGCIWMRSYLFVVEHPYYVLTDEAGRFSLPDVPPGSYELVCWLPNYREAGRELDPNTALPVRLTFAPSVQKKQTLTVLPGKRTVANFLLTEGDFAAAPGR